VGHVKKEFTAKEPELIKYLPAVIRMEKHFTGLTFCHIPRSENAEADELAKAAAQRAPLPTYVFLSRAVSQSNKRRRGMTQHRAYYLK